MFLTSMLKSTFSAEIFICRLFWSISSHFVAIHCRNVRCIQKLRNIHQKPFLRSSRSFKVIDKSKSLSPVLLMISNKCVPICRRFHTRRTNKVKITSFRGVSFFDALVRGEPPHPGAQNFVTKN